METYDPELQVAPEDFNELNEIAIFMGRSVNEYQTVNGRELAFILEKRGIMIVDIRAAGEYRKGHIRGAVNIPLDSIEERAPALYGSGAGIVIYGRGGDTMEAAVAADKFKTLFFKSVFVYRDGVLDWLRNGYRLETGAGEARAAA